MATKKSSSAAKKKAAPKKQAAKKKTTNARTSNAKESQASLFAHDESAQVSLQAATTSEASTSDKSNESSGGLYLFLVLAGIAVLFYVGYAKYKSKPSEANVAPAALETPAPKVEETKPPETNVEGTTPPEEAAKASDSKFLTDKIQSGKKWDEATTYCQSLGANLPSKLELADFSKSADKELKTDDQYWTKNFANATKAYAFSFKSGKSTSALKTAKLKVLCKN
ncbi:hypothetical protein LPTSP4_28120 [Leptospira ryugenii]|uniref:Uncharacterized protein n=1 Tax=Leptospira ryugenii TaxID=1917863 RepID=A0A2P2E332_9LEPT|nr:hypothetical protein [Leptospira ryugenii]GBF51280.1 hypothetical protein LPTSP4_28120 [Leptospira ryugenii]